MRKERRYTARVGVHLDLRPGIVIFQTSILGFDTDERCIAGGDALPCSSARVIRASSGHDVVCAVSREQKIG
jgi:hypothetical protein